jgi:hypothetical protein
MRSVLIVLIAVLMTGIVLSVVSSCATVPKGPLAAGELRLLSMNVPGSKSIKAKSLYEVIINFQADGKPEIETACFSWSGDEPRCYKPKEVKFGSPGTIKVQLYTFNPAEYILKGYVVYIREGKTQKSNVVGSAISVIKGGKQR